MGLSFFLFVGCLGGGEEAAPQNANDNAASGSQTPTDNPTVTEPTNPPPPEPTEPTTSPGDKVEVSAGTQGATYPAIGSNINYDVNPTVEPNTDINAPIIALISHPSPYIPQATGSITLWAADDVNGIGLKEIECSIDGGNYNQCDNQVIMDNLSDGLHTIEARAVDYDGNQSGVVSYAFYVDTTAPVVSIVNQPTPSTNQPTAQFEFQAQDAGSGISTYQCRIDSSQYENCESSEIFSNLADGAHTVTVRAVDNVGNLSQPTSYQWVVDTQGPQIQFVTRPPAIVYIETDQPMINFTVSDLLSPNGITTRCTLNGVARACAAGQTISIPTASPTSYTFTVIATDQAGNSSTSTVNWQSVFLAENRSTTISVGDDRPVDILFVVDNSGSMNFERSNLAQRIDGMISQIAGLDWQIAITSTDATNNNERSNGQLIPLMGLTGEYILDSNMDVNVAQSIFGNTVQNFAGGSGNEEGIYSAKRVIDRYIAGQGAHREFIRNGSDLSIVVLSDEDEASNGQNIRITPQNFVNFVDTTFNGTKNMVFHSIIVRPGDSACLQGEGAFYGNTYDQLSRLTGFGQTGGAIIGSVCNADYTSQLRDIGQSVKDLKNSIRLECPPYDANGDGRPDVVVSYRATPTAAYTIYTAPHQVQGDLVTFTDLLPKGDFKADYQCRIN